MTKDTPINNLLVTGGAGYVGSVLVPRLLSEGYRVKVLDLYLYDPKPLESVAGNPNLEEIHGDLRDRKLLEKIIPGCDAVIHLACISNDPGFELNPQLAKTINYDAFLDLVDVSLDSGVRRFVYASSSSVYGVKEEKNVTEELILEPLTDYSKYKALCEEALLKKRKPGFETIILRPATVCGYAPRLRLDLSVNILTNHAINKRVIKVFGGDQLRPNIHIDDVADLYIESLRWPAEKVDGQIFNAGYENHTIRELAEMVREGVGSDVRIETTPSNDNRSYHISSEKIRRLVGYAPKKTIRDAISDLVAAFKAGKIPDSMNDPRYYNIRTLQKINLQ